MNTHRLHFDSQFPIGECMWREITAVDGTSDSTICWHFSIFYYYYYQMGKEFDYLITFLLSEANSSTSSIMGKGFGYTVICLNHYYVEWVWRFQTLKFDLRTYISPPM